MTYTTRAGRSADTTPIYLQGSTTQTADGDGSAVETGDARTARLTLDATISGTDPTFDVTVEASPSGASGTWYTSGTFTQLTATGSARKSFLCDRFMRASWDIAGDDVGSTSAVVQSGAGPAVTITGSPVETASGTITIAVTDGARGTAEFDWEYGAENDTGVLTAATVVLGTTGLTANFAAGSYVAAEEYTWTGIAPAPDTEVTFSITGEVV